jgi:diacylglycerol kinase (ATP)
MRTLCLYNQEAASMKGVDMARLLKARSYWGETVFHRLRPDDIPSPGWLARLPGADRVLIAGGDGTLHHVIQHLVGKPQEINLMPAGNANDFGRWIGLSPDPEKTLDILEKGKTMKYDTISANGRHIISGGGFGLGYSVARSAMGLRKSAGGRIARRLLKDKVYSFFLVWHSLVSRRKGLRLKVRDEAGARYYVSCACIFVNQSTLGKNILVAPGTNPSDGSFHFLLFENPSCPSVLRSVVKIRMGMGGRDRYQHRRETERMHISCAESLPAFGDGELIPESEDWEIRCHKGSLNMRVSEGFNGR